MKPSIKLVALVSIISIPALTAYAVEETAIQASPTTSAPAATPAPAAATPAPIAATPAPAAATPAPIAATPAPIAATPAPVAATPAPVAATPAPVAATPAPVAATPAPVAATPAPVAATPVPVVVSAANDPLNTSNFTPHIRVQSRYAIFDSTLKDGMNFISSTARFSFTYRFKNVSAIAEFQAGSSPTIDSTSTSISSTGTAYERQNLFVARRANIGLDLVKKDKATVTFVLGRDRISGSNISAVPDAMSLVSLNFENASSTLGEDGVGLKYLGNFKVTKVMAGIGYYTNAGFTVPLNAGSVTFASNSSVQGYDYSYPYGGGSATMTQSRATVVYFGLDFPKAGSGTLQLRSLYAAQPLVPVSDVATASTATATTPALGVYQARDASSFEASANYLLKGLSFGTWFQDLKLGQLEQSTSVDSNHMTYQGLVGDKYRPQTVISVGTGVSGDSSLFGITDLIDSGDMLTYGLSYQNISGFLYGQSINTNVNYTAAAFGYKQGMLSLDFNYLYALANNSIFVNGNSGIAAAINTTAKSSSYQKNAGIFYLNGVMAL